MDGRLREIQLLERDYSILRDIYEFYYIDFYTARHRYFGEVEDDKKARDSFNRRMGLMVKHDIVAAMPFFSDRRKGIGGAANYAYTLTKKGLQLLEDKWGADGLEWDTTRKERKSIYIIHHLNVLYFACLYSSEIKSGDLLDYNGEQSSRFLLPDAKGNLKDFVKPDGVVFWKTGDIVTPWNVEYERNSRASDELIVRKLVNHSEYGKKGYYIQHQVMRDHDVQQKPILFLYCENERVANRRIKLITKHDIQFFDVRKNFGYQEILLGVQHEVEANPRGCVFIRPIGERVSITHVNFIAQLGKRFASQKISIAPKDLSYWWVPSYLITTPDTVWDGVAVFGNDQSQGTFLVRYFPEYIPNEIVSKELSRWAAVSKEEKLSSHVLLKNSFETGNLPRALIIVDTIEQEEMILKELASNDFGPQFKRLYVSRRELVQDDPYGAHWLRPDGESRVLPIK